MNCNISGEVCEIPVISPFGHVFEKNLIEKHIKETGKCPVTEQSLKIEDMIQIKPSNRAAKPRPPTATSLASLLKLFQNQWDSTMLETFTLKKQFESVKQELSNSLYQYDAACRVIARLIKERDEAKQALADTQKNMAAVIATTEKSESDPFSSALRLISENAKSLSKQRKKMRKEIAAKIIPLSSIKKFSKKWSIGSKTKKFNSFEITKNNIFIGNDDGSIGVYDQNSTKNELKPTLKNYLDHHSDRISKLSSFSPKTFVSASHDNSIAIWDKSDKFDLRKSLKPHSDKITGLSIQPMRRHFATCSYDKTWAFIDLEYAKKLRNSEKQESELICISFHPDGLIFGAGSNGGALKMWDIKSQSDVATFEHGKTSVTAIAFSENGYYLASGGSDGVVRLWDLRKSDTIAKLPKLSSAVDDVVFDPFGGYLAVCGDFGLSLYTSKKWESVKNLNKKGAIAINFDEDRLTAIQKNGSGLISYAV